jgi:hypothetical protein
MEAGCFLAERRPKKVARFSLPNSHRVPWAVLRNNFKLQCLAMQKERSGQRKTDPKKTFKISESRLRLRRRKNPTGQWQRNKIMSDVVDVHTRKVKRTLDELEKRQRLLVQRRKIMKLDKIHSTFA